MSSGIITPLVFVVPCKESILPQKFGVMSLIERGPLRLGSSGSGTDGTLPRNPLAHFFTTVLVVGTRRAENKFLKYLVPYPSPAHNRTTGQPTRHRKIVSASSA